MKIVKFKTQEFGLLEPGTIVNCFLLVKDGNRALLYHPPVIHHLSILGENMQGCGVFIIAKKRDNKDYWEDVNKNSWINQVTIGRKLKKFLATNFNVKKLRKSRGA